MGNRVLAGAILLVMFMLQPSPILGGQFNDIEIDGLIIDQTKSKLGHDFASDFSLFWESGATGYNMVISEQINFRAGSWISVEINGELVFKALMKPSAEEIENLAREAVAVCNEFMANQNEAVKNLEMEQDMRGNGIY